MFLSSFLGSISTVYYKLIVHSIGPDSGSKQDRENQSERRTCGLLKLEAVEIETEARFRNFDWCQVAEISL